jgi:hypothetical protein
LCQSDTVEGAVNTIRVLVGPELIELPRQIDGVPKEHAIEVLASDRADHVLAAANASAADINGLGKIEAPDHDHA